MRDERPERYHVTRSRDGYIQYITVTILTVEEHQVALERDVHVQLMQLYAFRRGCQFITE